MQLNASIALPPTTLQPFSNPPPNARAVNSLFYASLGFSLSNVTLGLLCLQWLRELKADTTVVPDRDFPGLHWVRHHGFQTWGAKGLVNALPLLLLSSLTCFFAGLLIHISTTDWVVSLPVSVVLGVTFAILILTTLLPAVVIARYAAFHPGGYGGGYPPIPPFHSLQSWIALHLTITLLKGAIFKNVAMLRMSLQELKQCPDWGRVSLYWQGFAATNRPILLPLVHSIGNPSRMHDVTLCLDDVEGVAANPNSPEAKITILRTFVGDYSKWLPSRTQDDLKIQLVIRLTNYFNGGADLADIGDLDFEAGLKFPSLPSASSGAVLYMSYTNSPVSLSPLEISRQLLHAVAQSYERKLPVATTSWDFLWNAMIVHITLPHPRHMSPILIIRVLNVVGEYGRQYSNADQAALPTYNRFFYLFSYHLALYSSFTSNDAGKRVVASILFHPAWNELASAARSLPSLPDFYRLQSTLDTLEAFKSQHALHDYAPLCFDWTGQLYPGSESSKSHISIDMDSGARVEEIQPSVPVDHPPSAPALPDGAKEDREVVVGPGDGVTAILNLGTMSSPKSLSIPPSETGHHTISSSVLVSVPALHTEAGEDSDVEPGYAPFVLEEVKEEEREEEKVDGSSVDRRLTVSRLGDGD